MIRRTFTPHPRSVSSAMNILEKYTKTQDQFLKTQQEQQTVQDSELVPSEVSKNSWHKNSNIKKSVADTILFTIGEHSAIWETLDKPSQIINKMLRDFTALASNSKVAQEVYKILFGYTNNKSIPSYQLFLRTPLRSLSLSNPLLTKEKHEEILLREYELLQNQNTFITVTNLFHFINTHIDSKVLQESLKKEILSSIIETDNYDKSTRQQRKKENLWLTFNEQKLNQVIKKIEYHLTSSNIGRTDKTYYLNSLQRIKQNYQESKQFSEDRNNYLTNIHQEFIKAQTSPIVGKEKEYQTEILLQYALIRARFALEWILRIIVLEPISQNILNKTAISESTKETFSLNFLLKQVITTMMGSLYNKVAREKYSPINSVGYRVGIDTEFHDYPKILIRSILVLVSVSLAGFMVNSAINKYNSLVELDENISPDSPQVKKITNGYKRIISSFFRLLSGSHISFRVEIKNIICDIVISVKEQLVKLNENLKKRYPNQPVDPSIQEFIDETDRFIEYISVAEKDTSSINFSHTMKFFDNIQDFSENIDYTEFTSLAPKHGDNTDNLTGTIDQVFYDIPQDLSNKNSSSGYIIQNQSILQDGDRDRDIPQETLQSELDKLMKNHQEVEKLFEEINLQKEEKKEHSNYTTTDGIYR